MLAEDDFNQLKQAYPKDTAVFISASQRRVQKVDVFDDGVERSGDSMTEGSQNARLKVRLARLTAASTTILDGTFPSDQRMHCQYGHRYGKYVTPVGKVTVFVCFVTDRWQCCKQGSSVFVEHAVKACKTDAPLRLSWVVGDVSGQKYVEFSQQHIRYQEEDGF